MEINWVELDEIDAFSKGHGVFLYHEGLNNMPMAFIQGYGWKHKTSNEITVEIIKPDNSTFLENDIDGNKLLDQLRQFINSFFAGKKVIKSGKFIGKCPAMIKMLFNG